MIVQNINSPCLANDGSFDVIYCLDMLEHVEDPRKVLENFATWIRPGGFLFLHTPSGIEVNFFRGARAGAHPGFRPVRPGDEHLRDGFNITEIRAWLEEFGFKVKKSAYTVNPALMFFKELYTLGERHRILGIGICTLPFIVLMTRLEMLFQPSTGSGLWVEAVKNHRI